MDILGGCDVDVHVESRLSRLPCTGGIAEVVKTEAGAGLFAVTRRRPREYSQEFGFPSGQWSQGWHGVSNEVDLHVFCK